MKEKNNLNMFSQEFGAHVWWLNGLMNPVDQYSH